MLERFLKRQCTFGGEWGKVMSSEWNTLLWIQWIEETALIQIPYEIFITFLEVMPQ